MGRLREKKTKLQDKDDVTCPLATGNVVTVDASCEWAAVSAGKGKMPGPVNITNYNNNATDRFYIFSLCLTYLGVNYHYNRF